MMLKIQAVEKSYAGRNQRVMALAEVSIELELGAIMTLRGPSGCGKTTLLLTAGGLMAPDKGAVTIDGQDIYALTGSARDQLRAREIGFVFQQFHLIPYLTMLDNLLVTAMTLESEAVAGARERALELAEEFGITKRLNHYPDELSTGERQRTALARAVMNKPRLILADEPTGNLDSDNAALVLDALERYASDGAAVIIASHDERAAGKNTQVWRMRDGRILRD